MRTEGRLCRFCLSIAANESFEEIGEKTKEVVKMLHLKLNFHTGAEHVCSNCIGSIQECLDFRSTCLDAENFIVSLHNSENKAKLNLREVYIHKNKDIATADIARDQQICRFCIKLSMGSSCKLLIEIEEEMTQKCIPELNFNLTKEPVICDSCLYSLKFYFQFLQTCADTEEKIIKYCKFETISTEGPINLNKVVEFTKNISDYERDNTRINIGHLDEHNENNIIKNEVIFEKENEEFYRQNAENNIKIKVEGNMNIEMQEEFLEPQNVELKMIFEQNELQSCANAEEEINKYYKLEATDRGSQINSNKAEQFTKDIAEYERDITEVNVALDGLCYDTNENNIIKTEVIVEKENAKYDSENIGNVISDDDENVVKMEIKKEFLEVHKEELETIIEQNELQTVQSGLESLRDVFAPSQIIMKNINTRVYKCERCLYAGKQKRDLKRHMLIHQELSEVAVYRCENCSYVTKRKGDLKRHILIHQELSDVRVFICDRCSYLTKQKGALRRHVLTHPGLSEVYRCDCCSFIATRKGSLKRHMLTHQQLSEISGYRCDICSYVTEQKVNLNSHMLTHRELSEVPVYRCDSCSFLAIRKGSLKRHMLTHREFSEVKVYKCDSCSFSAKNNGSVQRHRLTHRALSEVKVYKCDSCSYVARQKGCVTRHIILNHRDLSEVTIYRCDSCSYVTKQKGHLKRHMLTHRELSK